MGACELTEKSAQWKPVQDLKIGAVTHIEQVFLEATSRYRKERNKRVFKNHTFYDT